MHTHINTTLVHELIASQFPQWADLEINPIEPGGWDNRTFRLGQHMTVRLPSAQMYAAQVEKEQHWLPQLAPRLPLPIPVPLAMGHPGQGYPWQWSVYQWLEGHSASTACGVNLIPVATALAQFLSALQRCDATGGPAAGAHNFYRGGSLANYDEQTRHAIAKLDDQHEAKAMTALWNTALTSIWQGPPGWVHGDVAASNLLIQQNQLSAIIDWGCMGVGDPACDLTIAWTLFQDKSRQAFRTALALDTATWARARGWAMWKALCAPLPATPKVEVQRVINDVLAEHARPRQKRSSIINP